MFNLNFVNKKKELQGTFDKYIHGMFHNKFTDKQIDINMISIFGIKKLHMQIFYKFYNISQIS